MKDFGRYATLFALLCRVSLMRQMAYRPHFFLMIFGKVIRMVLLLLFFHAVFFKVDALGQWTFDQVLLLFATFHGGPPQSITFRETCRTTCQPSSRTAT
jgi:ABC-type uncharacterized transport system permease subunit